MDTKCPSQAPTVQGLNFACVVLSDKDLHFTKMYNSEIIRFCSSLSNPLSLRSCCPIFFYTVFVTCWVRWEMSPSNRFFNVVLSSPICICCLKHNAFLFLKVWTFLLCRIKSCYAQSSSINTRESFLEETQTFKITLHSFCLQFQLELWTDWRQYVMPSGMPGKAIRTTHGVTMSSSPSPNLLASGSDSVWHSLTLWTPCGL